MDKLLEFGRKALFVVRVLSGYEERRIRSYRLQLQRRLEQAQARKAALSRMVEEMQTVNRKLEETEAAIEEYFKPIDKEAQIIMNMQLEGEEKTMREMMKAKLEQAVLEKAAAEKMAKMSSADANCPNQNAVSTPQNEASVK